MPLVQVFHLRAELAGLALSAALRKLVAEASWSTVHRWIENRHVEVNGNLCTDRGRKLAATDVVKLWQEPRAAPPKPDELKIRYLDRHLVVVEKPAGVTTVRHSEELDWSPRRRQLQPTLDEMLQRVIARKAKSENGRQAPPRRGRRQDDRAAEPARSPQDRSPQHGRGMHLRVRAVHRLDRDTSGLMLFALSAEAERRLVQMFRKHEVQRTYLAVAIGNVMQQSIESRLVRDRGDGRRGSTDDPKLGKPAITHVRALERLAGHTLVECQLETGRTHQIRIHLAEAGHPLCGEKVYHKPFRGAAAKDVSGAPRQALHAARLELQHPITGEKLRFEMPLPEDMRRLIERLRERP